jgi:hypothetical protein
MIKLYNKVKEIFKDIIRLIYFCPLNYKNGHFTLFKINEQEEVICHYYLIIDKGVIDSIMKLTRVGRLVKVRCSFNDEGGDAPNLIIRGV